MHILQLKHTQLIWYDVAKNVKSLESAWKFLLVVLWSAGGGAVTSRDHG